MSSIEHTLKANGKSWIFKIGGSGCDKSVSRNPTILYKNPITIYCYGQDSRAVYKTDEQLILTIADGHGPKEYGRKISYKLHEYLITYMSGISEFILEEIKKNNKSIIENIVKGMFNHVNDIILNEDDETSKFTDGGSTFTMIQKIIDIETGNLYSLCYNVGDSPCFKIETHENDISLKELTQEQNCDNIQVIEDYCNECLKKGLTPSKVILGRFNTEKGYKVPWMDYNLIYPYKYTIINDKYKVTHNIDVMKSFYDNADTTLKETTLNNGGPQSIRGRTTNIKKIENGKYPMENFGSTLESSLQTPSSFGDKQSKYKHNINCIPYTSIEVNNHEKIYEFMGSDGAIDCLTNEEIIKLFKYKISKKMHIDEFIKFMDSSIDIQAKLGGFPFTKDTELPKWDDISYWVVSTEYKEDLEYKIKKLEKENEEMVKMALKIQDEIEYINSVLNNID